MLNLRQTLWFGIHADSTAGKRGRTTFLESLLSLDVPEPALNVGKRFIVAIRAAAGHERRIATSSSSTSVQNPAEKSRKLEVVLTNLKRTHAPGAC
jgi:hypothetical protein